MNRASRHVLMVLEGPYPAARGGGAEAQVRTLTRAMRARGQPVTVLVPLTPDGPQQRVSRVDGVPVCRLRYPRWRGVGGPVLWAVLATFLLARRHRYRVWHVHVARSWAVVCALLAHPLRKRLVIKVSGSWDLEHGALAPRAGVVQRMARAALQRTDAWQAISQRIAGTLAERGIAHQRITAIPNAVDTARFAAILPAAGGGARFVFVGRLVEEKGIAELLEAFAQLAGTAARDDGGTGRPDRDDPPHLLIVGTGPLQAALQARVLALGLGEAVEFAGHREDVEAVIARSNIGLLTSRTEGLSNALLECMASGLPMVASRISGNEDFVVHGDNGWLYEHGDHDALVACLAAAAAATPGQRRAMGERARAAVARKAGLDTVLTSLARLYAGRAGVDESPTRAPTAPIGNRST